jgi:hypothetical protein
MEDKKGWVHLTPETLAQLYSPYKSVTYTVKPYNAVKRVVIDKLLNDLHTMQLDFVDEALEKSDLREANEVIKHIMEKK